MPAARFHQAKTNGHPDTNNYLNDAKNQNHNSKSQFVIVWVLGVTSGFWKWVHPSITIMKIVCIFNCCTVETDDYSTKHSRCDGEPHEYTSLQNKIIKYSCHKGRCFTGTISVCEHLWQVLQWNKWLHILSTCHHNRNWNKQKLLSNIPFFEINFRLLSYRWTWS